MADRQSANIPETCSLQELERALDCGPDDKVHGRLRTIHFLLVGATYKVALLNSHVSERTFLLCNASFKKLRIDGLIYRPGCSRRRKLEPHPV